MTESRARQIASTALILAASVFLHAQAIEPVLVIEIPHHIYFHTMSITRVQDAYFMINGGSSNHGQILTFKLDGELVLDTPTILNGRSIFYSPYTERMYVKILGYDLYYVNPYNGMTQLSAEGIFHEYQSSVAFDPNGGTEGYIYENVRGDVYVIDAANGATIDTLPGLRVGEFPYDMSIATDGQRLVTWSERRIFFYTMDGRFIEAIHTPVDHECYGFSLSFGGNLLFMADDADGGSGGGDGVWHGYDLGLAGLRDDRGGLPGAVRVFPNYPNPFNATTVIPYEVDSPAQLRLEIFDAAGRLVSEMTNAARLAGPGRLVWDGSAYPSGVYFYRVTADARTCAGKMILLK